MGPIFKGLRRQRKQTRKTLHFFKNDRKLEVYPYILIRPRLLARRRVNESSCSPGCRTCSPGSRENSVEFTRQPCRNMYLPGSDNTAEVQLYTPASCQPGSRVIPAAFFDVEKPFLFSDFTIKAAKLENK